jgi:hypothetical protein
VEASLIAIERCKNFEEIEPEKTYQFINEDIKNYELPKGGKHLKSLIYKSVKRARLPP